MSKKSYKRLDDVYLSNSFARPVPGAPHTTVLFIKEDATVLIQKDQEDKVDQFRITNQAADKIIKTLSVEEPSKEKIINFLSQKGYSRDAFEGRGFNLVINSLFDHSEEEIKSLSKFIDKQDKPKILDNSSGNLISIGSSNGIAQSLISTLATVGPLFDSSGNKVGPGEIALGIIFSDLRNSSASGDLELNGQRVEVKASGGRMGPRGSMGGPSIGSTRFITPFVKTREQQAEYTRIVLGSKFAKRVTQPGGDLIYNMIASYNFVNDKDAIYNHILDEIDSFYSYGQRLAGSVISKQMLESANYEQLKNGVFKIYVKGYLDRHKVDGYLINIDQKLNYVIGTKDQILTNGGFIDTGKIKLRNNFRFNDLYPGIVIGK